MDFKRVLWGAPLALSACLSFTPLDQSSLSFMSAPGTDVSCLDRSATTIESYWNGEMGDSTHVDAFWGCATKAVNVFQSRVRGAQPGEYTAGEVRTLVSKFFIRGAVISDRLLEQTMKLKSAFLGGPADRVTAAELKQVKAWISLFEEQSQRVYPYVGYFVGRKRLDDASVEEASRVVAGLADRVGRELAHAGIALEFETLRAILDELSRFVDSAALGTDIAGLRDRVVVLEMIKADLVGGAGTEISGDEWVEIFRRLGQTARWYLKLKQLDQ